MRTPSQEPTIPDDSVQPPSARNLWERLWLPVPGSRHLSPARLVLVGYLSYILIGWLLLCLPGASAQAGSPVSALDHLFISTSALSTTGLATVSVSDRYSLFGQIIILALIQLGGIGYMTVGSFIILSRQEALPPERAEIGRSVFSLPASFDINRFIRHVVQFTLVIEAVGALYLYGIFRGASEAALPSLWSAVFHSVSAFCTAGFSLYNTSFEAFTFHPELNIALAILSYLGAIGFIVFADVWGFLNSRSNALTLTTKIILWFTGALSLLGTLLLFFGEPSFQTLPPDQRLLPAFFQAMSALTTVGFNTVGIGPLAKASVLVLIMLMIIGASPSGTGGGVKSTTIAALIGVMRSAVHGRQEVRFWNRIVPLTRVWVAIASLGFYLSALIIGTYLLELSESSAFDQNFFEAASALGTVGLSMGITASLTNAGKWIIILLMFLGRVGPLTFGTALLGESPEAAPAGQPDDLVV